MILRLMKWWLNNHGYYIVPFSFVGVMMGGNCVATGTPEQLNVYNPSKKYVALTGTIVMFDEPKAES